MKNEPKLSGVIKAIAEHLLSKSHPLPTSEAAHAALLCAHAGWNRALGYPLIGYELVLATLEVDRPSFWQELKARNAAELIALAETQKARLWSDDRRVILVCGIVDEKVHVEWCYESEYEVAKKQVDAAARNPPPWLRRIGPPMSG